MILILPEDGLRIHLSYEKAAQLSVYHKKQYVKLIASLEDELFLDSPFPYLIEGEGGKVSEKKNQYYLIQDALHFPQLSTTIKTKLYDKIRCSLRDELKLSGLEKSHEDIVESILSVNDFMWGNYCFESDWDIRQFLKVFKFGPSLPDAISVLDNQIAFFELLCDLDLQKPIIYANMRKNIDDKDLEILIKQANYYRLPVLFIESGCTDEEPSDISFYMIDQDFCTFEFSQKD